MHVEVKVAQNFVLNFLYNKLPRRRVNLFGEELESALRDKFADHWYPDKPFKGSAFRCLKITDPADPVLNRAARESGNPVPDIVENLPTDLAIWIDPGEVSYRMGEKGSVKILYSESMDPSYLQSYAMAPDDASPEAAAVAAATAAAIAAASSAFHPVSSHGGGHGHGHGGHGGQRGGPGGGPGGPGGPANNGPNFLPLDNLNLSIGGLSLNTAGPQANSPTAPPQVSPQPPPVVGVGGSQSSQSKPGGVVAPVLPGGGGPPGPAGPAGPGGAPNSNGGGSGTGNGSGGNNSNGGGGFAPFTPRQHQPITYTAGSFAQTKFGSTKLKSNAKKTNRMSPTEFSNYIKQRAMQKQATGPPTVGVPVGVPGPGNAPPPVVPPTNMANGFGQSGGGRGPPMNNRGAGGPASHGNLNYGGGSGRIPPHQQNPDPYFYPLFPDRSGANGQTVVNQNNGVGGGGGSGFIPYQQTTGTGNTTAVPAVNNGGGNPLFGGGNSVNNSGNSVSSSGSSSASSTTSNPWSFGDADAELFLQDILTVGLNSSTSNNKSNHSNNKLDLGFGSGSVHTHCGSDNTNVQVESNNSFGLGNFHFGGSGNNGTLMSNNHFGNSTTNMVGTNSLFGLDACTDSFGNSSGNGSLKPEHHHRSPQGSPASGNVSGNNGSSEQKYQQRVLVAN
jgi:protein Tob/BTG